MDDLIDRNQLLKWLKVSDFENCTGDECFRYTIQEIEEAPAVNRWIMCSEMRPESKEGVIFTVDRGHPFVCVGYRINNEREKLQRWFDKLSGLNFSDYDVTAWKPLPDAYEQPKEV